MIRKSFAGAVLVGALVSMTACSTHTRVRMPPRLDLRSLGSIGMLEFSPSSGGQLNVEASRELVAVVHSAQPGVPTLELGAEQQILASLGHHTMDAEAVRAIGKKHHVDVLLVGTLDARRIKPSIRLGRDTESVSASAEIEGALTMRRYDTRSGATLWSAASRGSERLASIHVAGGGLAGIGAYDPQGAESRMVRGLVYRATDDFRPYWVRQ
ncbi:MAG: hypothetical protein E4H03_03195 [Myxococcales bacterium]|jgi:hypothetical protein|nr:MAG: hypothetical protein E4H03_03195 [Myxococcales bacterium]